MLITGYACDIMTAKQPWYLHIPAGVFAAQSGRIKNIVAFRYA